MGKSSTKHNSQIKISLPIYFVLSMYGMIISTNLQTKITWFIKIFFIGMVRQFLAHTIITYGFQLPSSLAFIWVWKEVIIVGLSLLIGWFTIKNHHYRTQLRWNKLFITIIALIICSGSISLFNSLIIHGQSIQEFIISAKFNYIPLLIFIVWAGSSYLINKEQTESIISTVITTIKRVLIFSLFWYGILHTIPNVLDWIGFAQPGMSIEWSAGTPPPSLYLTDFYSGYVRNQGPFGGPLSLWFYVVAMRRFFYAFQLHKKKLSDTRGRWLLYIMIVISTYSRAARGIFLVSSILLLLLIQRKYSKYIIALGATGILAIIVYILSGGTSELFLRTRSDKGHIEYFIQGMELVKQHWLWGLGASSVGPWSHHMSDIEKVFNPENQYMQIWLEYGLGGVITWILSYITILIHPCKQRYQHWIQKIKTPLSPTTIAYIGIFAGIISLSIAGMVLHPFVDSSSIYPFMMLSGLIFWYYHRRQQYEHNHTTSTKQQPIKKTKKNHHKSHTQRWHQLLHYHINIWDYIPYLWTIIIGAFFVTQTYIVFWLWRGINTFLISTIRDILFWWIVLITLLQGRKQWTQFLKQYWFLLLPFLLLFITNVWHITQHPRGEAISLLAGIKYDIFHFFLIGSGIWLWFFIYKKQQGQALQRYLHWFFRFALILIGGWVLWQVLKNISPQFFIEYLWYSTPNDFIPFSKPPIYYITGAWGIERLNGFFVGPNTLWFFLITMTSFLYLMTKKYCSHKTLIILAILYLSVSLTTLSRSAVIGITIQILILICFHNAFQGITSRKQSLYNLFKKQWLYILLTVVASSLTLLYMNTRKEGSNTERDSMKTTITSILSTTIPLWGYGPGFVWPARHYHHDYQNNPKNDHAMLENIYLQTLINQWRIGLFALLYLLIGLLYIHIRLRRRQNTFFILQTHYLWLWLLGLLSVWRFLHIFIDSMVGYLFLIPYSILISYSYSHIRHEETISKNQKLSM